MTQTLAFTYYLYTVREGGNGWDAVASSRDLTRAEKDNIETLLGSGTDYKLLGCLWHKDGNIRGFMLTYNGNYHKLREKLGSVIDVMSKDMKVAVYSV